METDGVDTVAGASRVAVDGEVLGNCQYLANLIHESVGGDLFAIETVQEYPGTHQPLLDFAWDEKAQNARPELGADVRDGYTVSRGDVAGDAVNLRNWIDSLNLQ